MFKVQKPLSQSLPPLETIESPTLADHLVNCHLNGVDPKSLILDYINGTY
jgi:hypothetical protein